MSGRPILTDARIRLALAPPPEAVAPSGLLGDALEIAARTRQQWALLRLPWASGAVGQLRWKPSPMFAWLALALIIVALVGVAIVAGQRPKVEPAVVAQQPTAIPQPSRGGPAGAMQVVAVSVGEAYLVAGDERPELWHFLDGEWEGPDMLPDAVRSITVLPDGRLAAAVPAGLFVRGSGGWALTPFAIDAWAVTQSADGSLWTTQRVELEHYLVHLVEVDGSWQEAARTACPGGGSTLAVTTDGAVWSGGFGYAGTGGLARYDGRTCSAITLPDGSERPDVMALTAGPFGELAVAAFDPPFDNGARRAVLMVHDGSTWSTLKVVPDLDGWGGSIDFIRSGDLFVNAMPDGFARWHRSDAGWAEAPAAVQVPVGLPGSFASDGTLWYIDSSGEIRRARP